MLNLASQTPDGWAERAAEHIDDVLLDHAHCEKKAAGAALRMLFRYPEHRFLQEPISRLAREELEHYERVLKLLDERGVAFGRQKPSPYGGRLHQLLRAGEPGHLIDLLLISALIEARSCERFQLLARAPVDAEIAALYGALLASEARHHQLYVDLAAELAPREEVRTRLRELAASEAAILEERTKLVRLHT